LALAGMALMRGGDGDLRALRNELEVAEHLRKSSGYRMLDPLKPKSRPSWRPVPVKTA